VSLLGRGILRIRSLQLVILAFAKVGITARAQLPQFNHVVVVIESGGGSASGNDSVAIVPDARCAVARVRQLPDRRGFGRPDPPSPQLRRGRQSGAPTVIRPALFGLAVN
jgi:hypothetical protein